MIDSFRHRGLRRKLTATMREKGITDSMVLTAMEMIPRHFFMDSSFMEYAYEDKSFPIGSGQTISQPYTVAFMTSLLEPEPGKKVLEVGTGSGYQASILCHIGAKVFSIERQKNLYLKTKELLSKKELHAFLKTKPRLFFGDGYKGLPSFAPFDRIIVTAAAPFIPGELTGQLAPHGILVIPVGEGNTQIMNKLIKDEHGQIRSEIHGTFRFVPMLNNKAAD